MAKGFWVLLNVDNVEKSVEFYKMLGLKAKRASEGPMSWGEVAATPDSGLVLWNKNEIGPNQSQPDLLAWLTGEMGKGVMINVGVPNAEKVWTKVNGLVTIDQPLADDPWGGKSFSVVDPDGYVVSLQDKFPGTSTKKRTARKVVKKAKKTARKAKKVVAKKRR